VRRALALSLTLVLLPSAPTARAQPTEGVRSAAAEPGSIKPSIVWKRIAFGARRKREMAAYSKRHYGKRTWRLTDPQVVVIHFTDGTSFASAWNYFDANVRHMGEYPGVCSQFVIDTDGTIYQLVNLRIRCRHAIGMNWTAIGIEHVGTSARQILRNREMMRASLHLVSWLMARSGVSWGNVIGHAEILRSPYHRERYPSWRCLTHADWGSKDMRVYRRRLRHAARRLDVRIGEGPRWIDNGC
jgi:beta-N-acetylhexosaminidase